jgi:hypothetical protein
LIRFIAPFAAARRPAGAARDASASMRQQFWNVRSATMPQILTRLKIDEVSSVDRGAGKGVRIMLMKNKDGSDADPSKKTVTSRITEYLGKLFGAATAAEWQAALDDSVAKLAASVKSIIEDDSVDKGDMLNKSFTQFHEHLNGEMTKQLSGRAPLQPNAEPGDKPMSAKLIKALGLKDDASEDEALKALTALQADLEKARGKKPDGTDGKDGKNGKDGEEPDADDAEKALKALPESIRKQLTLGADAMKEVEKLRRERELDGFKKRATDMGLPESEGETLQKAFDGDRASINKLLDFTKSGIAAAKTAGLLKEIGGTGGDRAGASAYEQLTALAAEMRKQHKDLTPEQAFAKVYSDPTNRDLVMREAVESGRVQA